MKTSNKHRIKPLLWALVFFLAAVAVSAIPPVLQQSYPTTGLGIIYPKTNYYPDSGNLTLKFMVVNSSGHIMTNTTTSCGIYYYTPNSTHITDTNIRWDNNKLNFYHSISPEFVTRGELIYMVQCQNSYEAGFVSTSVNIGGSALADNPNLVIAFVLGVCLVAGLLVLIGNTLDTSHFVLKLAFTFFAFTLLLLVPTVLSNGVVRTVDNFFGAMIWVLRLFAVYVFLYFNYVLWLKSKLLDLNLMKKEPENLMKK